VFEELSIIKKKHAFLAERMKISDEPEVIYSLSYQDGLIHGFEHFLHHVDYGESLCRDRIQSVLRGYESLIKEKQLHRKWTDVAYFKGYLNAHIFVLIDEQNRPSPPYYLDLGLGKELFTLQEYKSSLKDTRGRKNLIHAYATQLAKTLPDQSIIFHHTPFS
jgi:hypothetical protein